MANSILQGNMPFDRSIYSKVEVDRLIEEHSHYIVSPVGNTYIRPTDEGNGVIERTIEVNKYLSITFGVDPTTGNATIDGFIPAHDDVPKEVVWSWTAPDAPAGGNYVLDLAGPFTSKSGSQVYVPSTSPVHDGFDPGAFYANLWGESMEAGDIPVFFVPSGTSYVLRETQGLLYPAGSRCPSEAVYGGVFGKDEIVWETDTSYDFSSVEEVASVEDEGWFERKIVLDPPLKTTGLSYRSVNDYNCSTHKYSTEGEFDSAYSLLKSIRLFYTKNQDGTIRLPAWVDLEFEARQDEVLHYNLIDSELYSRREFKETYHWYETRGLVPAYGAPDFPEDIDVIRNKSVFRIRYKNYPQWFTFDERGNFEGHNAEMAEGSCQGTYYEDTPSEVVSDSRIIATLDDITEVVGVKYVTQPPLGESEPVDNVVTVFHMPSGVAAGSYGEESDRTVAPGESFVVTKNGVNATGHVTEESEVSITLDVSAGNVMMGYDSNDRTVSEVIEEIQEEIGGGGGSSITERLDRLDEEVADLSNDLVDLSSDIDSRLDDLSNDIDSRLDALSNDLATHEHSYIVNGSTKVQANDDGTASIVDSLGQKGLYVPEDFTFRRVAPDDTGLVSFEGPYEKNGHWYWFPPGVDPDTFNPPGQPAGNHVILGGENSTDPIYVLLGGFFPMYSISGWNSDQTVLDRTDVGDMYVGDISVAEVSSKKTVATVDQIPTDVVSHRELEDGLYEKVSQNGYKMFIAQDGTVTVSGCEYRSQVSSVDPFFGTYCVVETERSFYENINNPGRIDFRIFRSSDNSLAYYARRDGSVWTVVTNELSSEASEHVPDKGSLAFVFFDQQDPADRFLHVYANNDSVSMEPWSGFTPMSASRTKTLSTVGAFIVEKTWSELKALRDGGTLVPGQWYRITDYKAATVQANTQSANRPFDIIVRADSESKLNENAYAIKNAEDTMYFINSKLEAWELKYCLDNDTTRFAWADTTNGRGVVYWMKDEFGNECPYDFKGITMKAYGDTDNVYRYTFDSGDASNNTDYSLSGSTRYVYNNVIGRYLSSNKLQLNQIVFKGGSCYSNTFGGNCYSSTFGGGCSANTFGNNCRLNTFGDSCSTNTFGNGCIDNTFGNLSQSNTFGNGCHSNMFGNDCSSNTFGNNCSTNTFGNDCSTNTFGNDCSTNTFGNDCSTNTFGNNCSTNTFGNDCSTNTFGNNCSTNTFGNDCSTNTFGNDCSTNTFGDCVLYGTFDPNTNRSAGVHLAYSGSIYKVNVRYRSLFSTVIRYNVDECLYYDGKYYKCTTAHRGAWNDSHFQEVQLVGYILVDDGSVLQSYFQNIIFENGVQQVALYCRASRTGSQYYQNVTVTSGVKGTAPDGTLIPDDNKEQPFKTTYRPANSKEISI